MINIKKGFNILFYWYLVLSVLMIYGCLNGYLSFGNGLGDLYYLIFNVIVLLIILIIYFYGMKIPNKTNSAKVFGMVLIVIIMVILMLKLTVLKGSEN